MILVTKPKVRLKDLKGRRPDLLAAEEWLRGRIRPELSNMEFGATGF
jgi:hypothetical protein